MCSCDKNYNGIPIFLHCLKKENVPLYEDLGLTVKIDLAVDTGSNESPMFT